MGVNRGVRSESYLQQFHAKGPLNPCSHLFQAKRGEPKQQQ